MAVNCLVCRTVRPLVVALACAGVLGCGEDSPDKLLSSAKSYLASNDKRAALIQLKNALQKEPNLAEARFLLGKALLDSEDAVAAEVELRKALDLKYPEASVLPLLAKALLLQGKDQRVIQDYAAVMLTEPAAAAELKTVLATAYAGAGNNVRAQAVLRDALRADPDFGPALLLQARLKADARDIDAALALVERIIAKDAGSYEALHLKGNLLFFGKADSASALQAERRALAIRKDWLPAQASVLEILVSRNEPVAARAQLAELKKTHPTHPETKYFEALIAFLDHDYKAARELIKQVLRVAPESVNALVLAGAIEMETGSLAQAENLVAKAMTLSPRDAVTRRLLAKIFLRSGEASKAQVTLAPLLERPDASAETLNFAGQAALQGGDAKSAEAYFSRAAKLDPGDVRNRTARALVQLTKGNAQLGLGELQEVASTDKGTVADMAIISARLRQSNYDAALKAIDALEQKQPDKPLAAQLRGQAQLARRDFAAARRSFSRALAIDPLYFPAAASLANLDLRDNRPDEARKRFDKLLAANPKNVRALLAVAELRAKAGAGTDEVAGLLADAIKQNPNEVAPRVLLVELRLRTGDSKAALVAAQEAVAALPDRYELLDSLGRAQAASGDMNQAISSFNKLASLQPRSPQPHLRLAKAYRLQGNVSAARLSLNRALEIAPKLLPAQLGLVQLEISAGRPDAAMAVARRIQSERPNESVGYMLAGDVEAFRKNWSAALSAYRAGFERGKSTELAARLYDTLASAMQLADADRFASDWAREHPKDAAFRLHRGDVALARQDLASAEAHYAAVVQLEPDNATALNNLAWVTNKLKKPGAAAYAQRAIGLRPGVPQFMDTLATILSDEGDVVKAIELEKKVVALQPEGHQYRLVLAKLYLTKGDKALAKTELETLAKLGDKFPQQREVRDLLGQL